MFGLLIISLIDQCLASARQAEKMWSDFFQRSEIVPLSITYEDLRHDYPGTVARVLACGFDFRIGSSSDRRPRSARRT